MVGIQIIQFCDIKSLKKYFIIMTHDKFKVKFYTNP